MPFSASDAHLILDNLLATHAGASAPAAPKRRTRKPPVVWPGSRYAGVKDISDLTTKGNMAEDFLAQTLRDIGYTNVVVKQGRRGGWDVKVTNKGRVAKFESKIATQDTSHEHQFNGIRHDTEYTHLFLLAVQPDELLYKIIAKKDRDDYTLTPMQQGTNNTFKLTLPRVGKEQFLLSFNHFESEVASIVGIP